MEKCFAPTVILLMLFVNERVIALGGSGMRRKTMILIVLIWGGRVNFIFGLV